MPFILGLTGGIATGKSTVSHFFKEYGIPVVDADVGAREVVQPGAPALKKIREIFGNQVFLESDELDREKLGKIIFDNEKKREQLNECLKEDIQKWILNEKNCLIKEGYNLIVLDIPLLFEAQYDKEVDEVMVVGVDAKTQLDRLMQRNQLSLEEAQARIDAQMPLEEKMKKADRVIENNGTKRETREQVLKWLNEKGYYTK